MAESRRTPFAAPRAARGRSLRAPPFAALLFVLIALAACASPRQGALVPVAAAPPGSARVAMLVATTRERTDAPGVLFTGERGEGVSYQDIVVSVPPQRDVGSVRWGAGDPTRDFSVLSETALAQKDFLRALARLTPRSGRVLVFIHGYNVGFETAVFHFAQLTHDMNGGFAPILFSWPSRGRLLDYVYDRESANFSRTDLADVLRAVVRNPGVKDVVVIAHSMGAWLATESLRQMALEDGRVPKKISNLILASPDLDLDVFRRQVQEMGPERPLITVFVSRNDKALRVSSLLAGGIARVGAIDLTDPDKIAELESARGVVVLDLTALRTSDRLNHSKFSTSPEVVRLLGDRLIAGRGLSGADGDLVTAADAIGGAVSRVALTPIVLFAGGGN